MICRRQRMNQCIMETIKSSKIIKMKIYKKAKITTREIINNYKINNILVDMINRNIYINKMINNIQNRNIKEKKKKKIGLIKLFVGCLALIKMILNCKEELRKHRNKKKFMQEWNKKIRKE